MGSSSLLKGAAAARSQVRSDPDLTKEIASNVMSHRDMEMGNDMGIKRLGLSSN